jgi:phosphoglycerate dehydrogenase-like enzyme
MGRVGQAVARRALGFDMEVLYSSPHSVAEDGVRVDLDELLGRSDHVVLCCALNDGTRGLIDRSRLMLMRPSAYLVNVSRGAVVVTGDLTRALADGWIAAAGLDVTDPEPLPPDHPLLDLPNSLVVPHIASASTSTRTAMARLAVENLLAGIEDRPLPAAHEPPR